MPNRRRVRQNVLMLRTYSYADAVKLLGAKENRVMAALDRIVGGILTSGATMGLSELLSWFDAKVDVVRLSHELLIKGGEARSGLSRYSQTERAEAAHAVVVVVAFFDAVDALDTVVTRHDIDLDRSRQLAITGLTSLFDGELPLPSPSQSYENSLMKLQWRYISAAAEYTHLVRASAVWNQLTEDAQSRLLEELDAVSKAAMVRYEELLRKLGGAYPELRFWFQVQDGVATRVALAEFERSIAGLLVGRSPDARRAELARKYRALLDRPLIEQEAVLPGLQVPPIGTAYVDPDFQVVPHGPGDQPSVLSWWEELPVRHDLYRYLTGYLTSPQAMRAPLLVLGDPGSGKSLFTKVLAARLPASDFLTLRVELRGTPTEADIVDQIQHGLRVALHEDLSWAELDRSAGDALPVVLLDGFDELMQATGVSQTRYLVKVQQFQCDRFENGRPVAIVVTSRISVCGGVHIPLGGDVLRLLPFAERHVEQWLDGWNTANETYFQQASLIPLAPGVAMRYPDLATQPLLLLMLALYDAPGNALQRAQGQIGEGDLYERLLTTFARREVSKDDEDRTEADLEGDIESELDRLAVVGFAMFNRGTQWVTEADLNDDLAGLLGVATTSRQPGMRSPLTAGEAVLGRFFFVQRSQAVRDEHTLRTYEFLHATFGEYLVARFTWRVLTDLHTVDRARPRRQAGAPLDDTELFELLSFTPLTMRRPVLIFLRDFAKGADDPDAHAELVLRLFAVAAQSSPRPDTTYHPVRRGVPARYAIYTLNLVLLGALLADPVHSGEFGISDWPRLTAFWKSQLTAAEWLTVLQSFSVVWLDGDCVILRYATSLTAPVLDPRQVKPLPHDPEVIAADAHFTADPVLNHLRYPLEPVLAANAPAWFARMMVDLGFSAIEDRATRDKWYLRAADFAPDVVLDQVSSDLQATPGILRALATTQLGTRVAFWNQLFNRIGKGGPDKELLTIVDEHWKHLHGTVDHAWITMLDAWLRLSEAGWQHPDVHDYPNLVELVTGLNLDAVHVARPDLGIRLERDGFVPPNERNWQEPPAPLPTDSTETPEAASNAWSPMRGWSPMQSRTMTWHAQLQELDQLLADGRLGADGYRTRRDRLLSWVPADERPS
jgi:hypothetical protein